MDKVIDQMLKEFMQPIMESGLKMNEALTLYAKLQNIVHNTLDSTTINQELTYPD